MYIVPELCCFVALVTAAAVVQGLESEFTGACARLHLYLSRGRGTPSVICFLREFVRDSCTCRGTSCCLPPVTDSNIHIVV